LTKKEEKAVLIFGRKMFRSIYGPKYENGEWKSLKNRELEEMKKGENVVKWIKGQRISWLGHLERMEEDRVPKKFLEGTRRRGRPKKRLKEEVERDLQVLGVRRWRELVADRKKWKDIDRPKPTVVCSASGRSMIVKELYVLPTLHLCVLYLSQSKGENAVKWIKGQRISWLRHLERIEEDRTPKKVFTQEMEGTRIRGRSRKRWKEEVERDLQVLGVRRWRELVADRKKWKDIDRPKPTLGCSANGRRRKGIKGCQRVIHTYFMVYFCLHIS